MYTTEILEKCADLAARTARVYRALAQRFLGDPDRVELWRELALEEETQADVLRRELATFEDQDHAGEFVPEYADRIQRLDKALRELEARAATAHSLDDALAVAVALEQTTLEDLYDDLVLQGEPAFRLISERIEAALAARPQPPTAVGLRLRYRRPTS